MEKEIKQHIKENKLWYKWEWIALWQTAYINRKWLVLEFRKDKTNAYENYNSKNEKIYNII